MNAVKDKQKKEFSLYSKNILVAIKDALQKSELNEIQTLAIFIQLTKARTKQELKDTVLRLSKKYPALNEVEIYERESVQLDYENTLQLIVSSLIKQGKAKEADQLLKKSKEEPESLSLLLQDYSDYFNPSDNA